MEMIKLGNQEISTTALDNLVKLANSIDEVNTQDNGQLYVKFKSDVIFETGNFAVLTDGFNVQYATQIHFNPEFEREIFKNMVTSSFSDAKYKIIEKAAGLLDRELTHDEIKHVIEGGTLTDYANYDPGKSKQPKPHKHTCDHD